MYGYCQFPIYSLGYNKIHIQSVYSPSRRDGEYTNNILRRNKFIMTA